MITGRRELERTLQLVLQVARPSEALARLAEELRVSVMELLSHEVGSDHTTPWLRTGALRESITSRSSETEAVVGSNNPVAVHQEFGTGRIPPRPFFSAAAGAEADRLVDSLAQQLAETLRSRQ